MNTFSSSQNNILFGIVCVLLRSGFAARDCSLQSIYTTRPSVLRVYKLFANPSLLRRGAAPMAIQFIHHDCEWIPNIVQIEGKSRLLLRCNYVQKSASGGCVQIAFHSTVFEAPANVLVDRMLKVCVR